MSEHLPSDQRFAIGEIAVFWRPESPNHGREVTISGPLGPSPFGTSDTATGRRCDGDLTYPVLEKSITGRDWYVKPEHLRKKRPPREDLQIVRWQECPWQPQQVRA